MILLRGDPPRHLGLVGSYSSPRLYHPHYILHILLYEAIRLVMKRK